MVYLIVSVIVLISVLLVFVVLAQNSKGGGLISGASSANQMMGAKRTTDTVEKATWVLGSSLFVLCLVATLALKTVSGDSEGGRTAAERALENESQTIDLRDEGADQGEEESLQPASEDEDEGALAPAEGDTTE